MFCFASSRAVYRFLNNCAREGVMTSEEAGATSSSLAAMLALLSLTYIAHILRDNRHEHN